MVMEQKSHLQVLWAQKSNLGALKARVLQEKPSLGLFRARVPVCEYGRCNSHAAKERLFRLCWREQQSRCSQGFGQGPSGNQPVHELETSPSWRARSCSGTVRKSSLLQLWG